MKTTVAILCLTVLLCGCVVSTPVPRITWNATTEAAAAEYEPYKASGTGITGQGFVNQNGGGVVRAAGASVNLDPATTVGNEWVEQPDYIVGQHSPRLVTHPR